MGFEKLFQYWEQSYSIKNSFLNYFMTQLPNYEKLRATKYFIIISKRTFSSEEIWDNTK